LLKHEAQAIVATGNLNRETLDKILDFFRVLVERCHHGKEEEFLIATSDLLVTDQGRVFEAAKRYFAEIMMPFRSVISKNLEKLKADDIHMIAPSHGQIYDKPDWIMDAYQDWVMDAPHNLVALPYVSMHGSTRKMVDHLSSALILHIVVNGGPDCQQETPVSRHCGAESSALVLRPGDPEGRAFPHRPPPPPPPFPPTIYTTFILTCIKL
jgi:hypothetical protein